MDTNTISACLTPSPSPPLPTNIQVLGLQLENYVTQDLAILRGKKWEGVMKNEGVLQVSLQNRVFTHLFLCVTAPPLCASFSHTALKAEAADRICLDNELRSNVNHGAYCCVLTQHCRDELPGFNS